MRKKFLLGALLLTVVAAIGLFLWVRAVLTHDHVRTALAAQLSSAIGQPVTIGSISATVLPRITVNLEQVGIGTPPTIHVDTLHLGTDLRALLSRRIEHARLELAGAHIELPLPAFSIGSGADGASTKPPVEIVSVDSIVLRGVEIVSGGRRITGDVEVEPQGRGLNIRQMTLVADEAKIEVNGTITDLSGPVGELSMKAGALSFDALLAFASDFAGGSGIGVNGSAGASQPAAASAAAQRVPMQIAIALEAARATMGQLTIAKVTGKARITSDTMTLDPIGFGVFGGRYDGSLVFTLQAVPDFRLNAALSGVDVAAATTFAGTPGVMTGRLAGKLNLTGRGMDAASVTKSARGSGRLDVTDGVVRNLGLIRAIVLATSGRSDTDSASDSGTRDEPFTSLGATMMIAGGSASTTDLRFESRNLLLSTGGAVRLDGSQIDLRGQVQLSDELSQRAGRDLIRYTQQDGRVTLPATISGSATAPSVRIDVAGLAKRALTNRATEEAQKALKKGLGELFKR